MAAIRSPVSVRRSSRPAAMPFARPRATSSALAATISGAFATRASAIACRAPSLVALVARASSRAAPRARRAIAKTASWTSSPVGVVASATTSAAGADGDAGACSMLVIPEG